MTVSRDELERALRRIHVAIDSLRDDLLVLGTQVADLTSHLAARDAIDEDELDATLAKSTETVRAADESWAMGIQLGEPLTNKYEVQSPPIPCDELLHLCKAKCCALTFSLSSQDLNEGKVRWDYTRPYRILQRDDGYCSHSTPDTRRCTIYDDRPAPCRTFDCRADKRIWADFDQRIPAADAGDGALGDSDEPDVLHEKMLDRVRERQLARGLEVSALRAMYGKQDD